jgi:predicted hydrocarbon binding protein
MNDSRRAPGKETQPVTEAQETGDGFRADLPLAILESVRTHDRPAEVLEDENLTASLPRRLGLTGVVESQIHRYRIARKRRERIPYSEVGDLLRLVLRRPDSEPILREAGHAIARQHARKPLYRLVAIGRVLPRALSSRIAARSLRRLLRRIGGGVPLRVTRVPLRISMTDPVTGRVDRWGTACILYAAAIEQAVADATGGRPGVEHVECQSRGDERCVWEAR